MRLSVCTNDRANRWVMSMGVYILYFIWRLVNVVEQEVRLLHTHTHIKIYIDGWIVAVSQNNIRKHGNYSWGDAPLRQRTMYDNGIASDFCMPIFVLKLHCNVDNASIIALNVYHSYAHSRRIQTAFLVYPLSLNEHTYIYSRTKSLGANSQKYFYFFYFFSFLPFFFWVNAEWLCKKIKNLRALGVYIYRKSPTSDSIKQTFSTCS